MVVDQLVIEPMTADFILWRCLHGGPLSRANINKWSADQAQNWERHRAINVPLLRKIIDTYGTCAMLARDGEQVVGFLRFYPKVLCSMEGAGEMCLQQAFPAGPSERFVETEFPPLDEIQDKTLTVHCMAVGSPHQNQNPYQRKGVGTRMVRELIRWAKEREWESIEAEAYQDIDILYAYTGNAGKSFWEKLGFGLVATASEPRLEEWKLFGKVREQGAAQGIKPEDCANAYTMRLELT